MNQDERRVYQESTLGGLYLDHVSRFGVDRRTDDGERRCWCSLTACDPHCDVGDALFRMRAKDIARRMGPMQRSDR